MRKILAYECKKNGNFAIVILLLLLLGYKGIVCFQYSEAYDTHYIEIMDEYISEVKDMKSEEAIKHLQVKKKESENWKEQAVLKHLLEQTGDIKYYENVKTNAKKGSVITINMPLDYMNHMDLYAKYPEPVLINQIGWNTFFELNKYNLLPLVCILMFSTIISNERENGMYKIIKSSSYGYQRLIRDKFILVLSVSFLIFHLNFIIDVILSNWVYPLKDLDKPLSSIHPSMLTDESILSFFLRFYFIGLLYTAFLSLLIIIVSSLVHNNRIALTVNVLFFSIFFAVSMVLPDAKWIVIPFIGSNITLFNNTSIMYFNALGKFSLEMIISVFYIIGVLILSMLFMWKEKNTHRIS